MKKYILSLFLIFFPSFLIAIEAVPIDALWSGLRDFNNQPLSGGKVYTYLAGTSVPKATFLTPDKSQIAPNPIILDAYGKAVVYAEGLYKFVIKNSNDATIGTIDFLSYGSLTNIQELTLSSLTANSGSFNNLTASKFTLTDGIISSATLSYCSFPNFEVQTGSVSSLIIASASTVLLNASSAFVSSISTNFLVASVVSSDYLSAPSGGISNFVSDSAFVNNLNALATGTFNSLTANSGFFNQYLRNNGITSFQGSVFFPTSPQTFVVFSNENNTWIGDPTSDFQIANKRYVDNLIKNISSTPANIYPSLSDLAYALVSVPATTDESLSGATLIASFSIHNPSNSDKTYFVKAKVYRYTAYPLEDITSADAKVFLWLTNHNRTEIYDKFYMINKNYRIIYNLTVSSIVNVPANSETFIHLYGLARKLQNENITYGEFGFLGYIQSSPFMVVPKAFEYFVVYR